MANFYCDHGAYGLASNRLGLDAPTWGSPQEGDGSAKDAASASSVGSILLNAQPVATNLLSICGISFGATSGGTINYTIGGTLTATVDNIVAAINGCTTTVAIGVAVGAPQLRNLVFARNSGGTTVQIMMRVGSANLNYASNASVGMTSSGWGTPPTITNFTGGSGGCWGWFLNTAALGVSSSIAAMAYGVMLFKPYVLGVGSALPTKYDQVWHRSGGGASKALVYAPPGALSMTRSAGYQPQHVIDTNLQWTSDSTAGVLSLQFNIATSNNVDINLDPDAGTFSISAVRRGGFNLIYNPTANGLLTFTAINIATGRLFKNVRFDDYGVGSLRYLRLDRAESASHSINLIDCDYYRMTSQTTLNGPFYSIGQYGSAQSYLLYGCSFNYNISGVSDPGPVIPLYGSTIKELNLDVRNCVFTGFASGLTLITLDANIKALTLGLQINISSCSGIKTPLAYGGVQATEQGAINSNLMRTPDYRRLFWNNEDAFRYENQAGVVEWLANDSTGFPTLVAKRPDGITGWSVRVWWLPNILNPGWLFTLPSLRQTNRLNPGNTVELKLFAPTSETFNPGTISFDVTYTSSGVQYTETLPAPASDAATWGNAGLYSGYVAKNLALTTAHTISQNTEVIITMTLTGNPASGAVTTFYIDPEFSIT